MKPKDKDDIYFQEELDKLNNIESDVNKKEIRDAKYLLKRRMSRARRIKEKREFLDALNENDE